jgi:pyruvate/2-oxoglutarate dehydrogenase complex dihydrolipoamide acyltransferase (E2) component
VARRAHLHWLPRDTRRIHIIRCAMLQANIRDAKDEPVLAVVSEGSHQQRQHTLHTGRVPFREMLPIYHGQLPAYPDKERADTSLHHVCKAWRADAANANALAHLFVVARIFAERIAREFQLRFSQVLMEGGAANDMPDHQDDWCVTHVAQETRGGKVLRLVHFAYDDAHGTLTVDTINQTEFEPTPEPPAPAPVPAPIATPELSEERRAQLAKHAQDMVEYERQCMIVTMQRQQEMMRILQQHQASQQQQQQQAQQQARQQAQAQQQQALMQMQMQQMKQQQVRQQQVQFTPQQQQQMQMQQWLQQQWLQQQWLQQQQQQQQAMQGRLLVKKP